MTSSTLNMQITRKEKVEKDDADKKPSYPLATVGARIVIGQDKGGEVGVMIPWARLSKADKSVTTLKQYLEALARDIANLARTAA